MNPNLQRNISSFFKSQALQTAGPMFYNSTMNAAESSIGTGGQPGVQTGVPLTQAGVAALIPDMNSTATTQSNLAPVQMDSRSGVAYYIEIGADLTGDLPPVAGGGTEGGGLQTGTFLQQKPFAPRYSVNLDSIRARTGSIDPSKYFVSWKLAIDSIYQKLDTDLKTTDSNNPNSEYKPEPVYLCSDELQNGGERYFVRTSPGSDFLPNLNTVAWARFDQKLPCQVSFYYPCYINPLPFDRTYWYANSPRKEGSRDLTTGQPMAEPFYTNQFIRSFNIRLVVTCDITPNLKPVYSVPNTFADIDNQTNAMTQQGDKAVEEPPPEPESAQYGDSKPPTPGGGSGGGSTNYKDDQQMRPDTASTIQSIQNSVSQLMAHDDSIVSKWNNISQIIGTGVSTLTNIGMMGGMMKGMNGIARTATAAAADAAAARAARGGADTLAGGARGAFRDASTDPMPAPARPIPPVDPVSLEDQSDLQLHQMLSRNFRRGGMSVEDAEARAYDMVSSSRQERGRPPFAPRSTAEARPMTDEMRRFHDSRIVTPSQRDAILRDTDLEMRSVVNRLSPFSSVSSMTDAQAAQIHADRMADFENTLNAPSGPGSAITTPRTEDLRPSPGFFSSATAPTSRTDVFGGIPDIPGELDDPYPSSQPAGRPMIGGASGVAPVRVMPTQEQMSLENALTGVSIEMRPPTVQEVNSHLRDLSTGLLDAEFGEEMTQRYTMGSFEDAAPAPEPVSAPPVTRFPPRVSGRGVATKSTRARRSIPKPSAPPQDLASATARLDFIENKPRTTRTKAGQQPRDPYARQRQLIDA